MELRHETTMVFHNVEYVLSLEVESEGDSLTMEVEDKASGSRWNGHFSSRCKQSYKTSAWVADWSHIIAVV